MKTAEKETIFFAFRCWMNGNEKNFSPIVQMSQWDLDHDNTQSWVSFRVFASKEEAETARSAEMCECGL